MKDEDTELLKRLKEVAEKRGKGDYEKKIEEKYNKNLHKELLDWKNTLNRKEINPADTLYRWWWEFMKTAEQYPRARQEALTASKNNNKKADKLKEVSEGFGELGTDFGAWWHRVGRHIFAEDTIPLIQVIKPDPTDEEYKRETGVIMIVPMTISRQLLIEQFKVVLDVYHPNTAFKRHAASTAKMKLYPRQRDVKKDYAQLLRVWCAKRENEAASKQKQKDDWELCCDVFGLEDLKKQLSRRNLARDERAAAGLQRNRLANEINDLYQQADELMRNALLGQFPRDDVYQSKKGRKSAEERKRVKRSDGDGGEVL